MKSLLFTTMLMLVSLSTIAQDLPHKFSDLPKNTHKHKVYNSNCDETGVLDTLLLLSKREGPYILRMCASKGIDPAALPYGDLISYRIGSMKEGKLQSRTVIDNQRFADIKNTARNSDFVVCQDEEFESSEKLNGKMMMISATGDSRQYYISAFPKNDPSKVLVPILVKSEPGITQLVIHLLAP